MPGFNRAAPIPGRLSAKYRFRVNKTVKLQSCRPHSGAVIAFPLPDSSYYTQFRLVYILHQPSFRYLAPRYPPGDPLRLRRLARGWPCRCGCCTSRKLVGLLFIVPGVLSFGIFVLFVLIVKGKYPAAPFYSGGYTWESKTKLTRNRQRHTRPYKFGHPLPQSPVKPLRPRQRHEAAGAEGVDR